MTQANEPTTQGNGWIIYSAIMLIVVGFSSIANAIWAWRYSDTVADVVVFEDDLAVWGWIFMIFGVVMIVAGLGVFNRAQWARWTGIVVICVGVYLITRSA